jgi:hypothetical protein
MMKQRVEKYSRVAYCRVVTLAHVAGAWRLSYLIERGLFVDLAAQAQSEGLVNYVVCLKRLVNGTRKQTKQKIQTN